MWVPRIFIFHGKIYKHLFYVYIIGTMPKTCSLVSFLLFVGQIYEIFEKMLENIFEMDRFIKSLQLIDPASKSKI